MKNRFFHVQPMLILQHQPSVTRNKNLCYANFTTEQKIMVNSIHSDHSDQSAVNCWALLVPPPSLSSSVELGPPFLLLFTRANMP